MPLCPCFGSDNEPADKDESKKSLAEPDAHETKGEETDKVRMGIEGSKSGKHPGEGLGHEMGDQMKTQVGRIKAIVGGRAAKDATKPTPQGVKTTAADYSFVLVSSGATSRWRAHGDALYIFT